jgi:hypothetical protein
VIRGGMAELEWLIAVRHGLSELGWLNKICELPSDFSGCGDESWLDAVNSDPDAEERDPEDDTIGYPGDEMAGWDLEGEEEDDEEEEE